MRGNRGLQVVFVEGFRLLVVLIGVIAGLQIGREISVTSIAPVIGATLGAFVTYVAGGVVGRTLDRGIGVVTRKLRDVPPAEVFAASLTGALGLLVALVAGLPLLGLVHSPIDYPSLAALCWVMAVLAARFGASKGEQFVETLNLSRRLSQRTEVPSGESALLDSSALMDKYLLILGRAGLLPRSLVLPQFVLDQVETIAAGPDPVSSRRAKRGLESLDALRMEGIEVRIAVEEVPEVEGVNEKVAVLAERLGTRLITCSGEVASIVEKHGSPVLDLRRLSSSLSPEHLPGEHLTVDLVRPGRQSRQAIGYLPDGDMVVVNDADHAIGQNGVQVVVASTRQTTQGVLVFASLLSSRPGESSSETQGTGGPASGTTASSGDVGTVPSARAVSTGGVSPSRAVAVEVHQETSHGDAPDAIETTQAG
ncbi:MAG: PIN domain-containing protein [Acidimicrobiales bacterium]